MRVVAASLSAAAFLASVSCGGAAPSSGPDATPAANLTISARALKFDKRFMTAPANTNVTIHFENRDAGVVHNVAVYKNRSAKEKIFGGETFSGDGARDYRFTTPASGEYFFRCDTHPDTMSGKFVVR